MKASIRDRLVHKTKAFSSPLVALFAVGLILRILTMILYRPSVLQWVDAIRYLRITPRGFFGDPYSPAGYSAFLRGIYAISSNLLVTIAVQHVVGLIGAAFIYLIVKRISGITWLSLIPASIILLSGDYIFLEHTLMSDGLFMTLVYISIYSAIRAIDAEHQRRWLAASGAIMIVSALVRPITLELPIIIGLWALWALRVPMRRWVSYVAATLIPAAIVLAGYLLLSSSIGPHTGLDEMTGWDLYSRAAPFAECSKFTPPPGTKVLCESTPPAQRNGPFYYSWVSSSPGLSHFPLTPEGSLKPGEFAKTAIKAQPFAYLKAIIKDMFRYIDPNAGTERAYSGIPYSLYQFNYTTPGEQEKIGRLIQRKGYTGVLPVHSGGVPELEAYQAIFHVGGLPILVMAVLALAGIVCERGRLRVAIVLLVGCAFLLFLFPVLTLSYDVRYGWPPTPLLAAAAVLSAYGMLAHRLGGRFAAQASEMRVRMRGTPDEQAC